MTDTADAISVLPTQPSQLSLTALFLKFLRFGALAFGGPVAQIAMIRQSLVEEEGWIEPRRFNRLLAILQILPGPEAHELCVHMGMVARGRIGGLLAGLGFMLPGFLLMLLAGWLYMGWIAGNPSMTGLLLGVQIVVLAIILRAVARIGQHIVESRLLGVIAAIAFAATLLGVPFWLLLAAGAIAHMMPDRPWLAIAIMLGLTVAAKLILPYLPLPHAAPIAASGAPVTLAMLFLAGLKGGLLTFGGAYTAIPYVRADTVGRGWISDATFLDGVALAGLLPAPLVIFATFVGYVVGGPAGAIAITVGMFLPAFAFSLLFFERLEAVVEHPALHHALAGVAAAVLGIIAATFVDLARATGAHINNGLIALPLFAVALLVAWRVKGAWVTPAIMGAGALMGCLLPL
ncbi:chromate efflux transporter [Sphingobium sp. YR768]|uniref:chromate efflux transporter n=1 Tax=Sphingobium sp. YR768 TaxID=1884365 RepID=UPI0008D1A37A|nr:chromate efflux transporter [Sphingobium sp. YR768]SEQ65793.1 chromate transporter [Sphingobium sp. YR768]